MNSGRTIFAQLMDFLPWSTFDRIVARYNSDRAVKTLTLGGAVSGDGFCATTYRESLRDI
jgi:hypothetical protein